MMKTEQTEQAVALRLKQVSRLRLLCLSLGRVSSAGPLGANHQEHICEIVTEVTPKNGRKDLES